MTEEFVNKEDALKNYNAKSFEHQMAIRAI